MLKSKRNRKDPEVKEGAAATDTAPANGKASATATAEQIIAERLKEKRAAAEKSGENGKTDTDKEASAKGDKDEKETAPSPLEGLTGLQKAAIFIISIGTRSAAQILKNMQEREVEEITMEIAAMRSVNPDISEAVLNEFYHTIKAKKFLLEGGYGYAEKLLTQVGAGIDSRKVLDRLREESHSSSIFEEFQDSKMNQITSFIQNEHPQVAALIFSQLDVERSSEILAHLDQDLQAEIIYRLASMDKISTEVIEEIEEVIREQMGGIHAMRDRVKSGTQTVAQILNEADITVERNIIENLEKRNAQLADEIKEQMLLFEDIADFDDRTVQVIINEMEKTDLVMGLKGVSEELSEKFLSNMSARAADMLQEDMEALGPVPLKDVKEAQQRIIRKIKDLEEEGEITTRKVDEEEVVE